MKRNKWIRLLALVLVIALAGCGNVSTPAVETEVQESSESQVEETVVSPTAEPTPVPTEESKHEHIFAKEKEVIAATCTSEGYTVYVCDCGETYNDNYTEKKEHSFEETVILPTTESEGYTLFLCTGCNYAYKDNYTDKLEEDILTAEQKNSIAMLNYLATLTQKINESRNSRMFLEEAYASLINNTNPEEVNELTESHLSSLLDLIEKYRVIAVKRERLEYIYNQNKAIALREAIPSPVSILSAASSLDMKRLAGSIAYMAIDSVSSYNTYNDELDQSFLQDGWVLDDEADEALHESRKYAFLFMIEMVREEELPGELALQESAVENFVTWINNDNIHQRLQFLESEEETYRAFGDYWLELAECYYELEDYDSCLKAVEMYGEYQADIFRKDYYLAQIMPITIAAASEVYSGKEYVTHVEEYLHVLIDNTESDEWALRYFAAQVYMDLYSQTGDMKYLDAAYDLALNNVNFLVNEQKDQTNEYLKAVEKVELPENASKEEKNQVKEYNKNLEENRKTELPPVYEPLMLNCELLYALLNKVDVGDSERAKIDSILGVNTNEVFLSKPLANRYASNKSALSVEAKFEKNTFGVTSLSIPVSCVSQNSALRVSVTDNGKTSVYDDWIVKEVNRSGENADFYTVVYTSENASNQKWSANSTIKIEILDEKGSEYDPVVLSFKVRKYSKFIVEAVEFEQVK